jgi:glycerol-3-phosphate dehydrogenase
VSRRATSPQARPFDRAERDRVVQELADSDFDVVVIGAGVAGAAIARDAALRGLSVLLVDQGDLGGASSASLALLPPGDRREQTRLGTLAPHLVRPIRLQVDPGDQGPRTARWSAALRGALGRFEGLHSGPALPGLADGIPRWGRTVSERRLALELARSAHDAGARVVPWLQVEGLRVSRARLHGIDWFDRLSGQHGPALGSVVVDATGPWTDRTRGLRGDRHRLLRPTRAACLALPGGLLPDDQGVQLGSDLIALPHAGVTLLSGAEVLHEGDFDGVLPSEAQLDRLRSEIDRVLPGTGSGRALGAWAGLVARPIEDADVPGVVPEEDGLISVVGGSAGGHRRLAEDALGAIADRLRVDGVHVGGSLTGAVPLPGGEGVGWTDRGVRTQGRTGVEAEAAAIEQLPPGSAQHLIHTYGGRWHDVATLAAEDPALAEPLVPGLPMIAAEVDHALTEELVCSLPDLLRRLDLPLLGLSAVDALAPALAAAAARAQDWTTDDVQRQLRFTEAWLAPMRDRLWGSKGE